MFRKLAVGLSAVALGVTGVMVAAGPASAAKPPPIDAHGTLHCAITGKISVKPNPLLFGGTAGATVFSGKFKSTTCSGSSGVTSVGGTLTATLPTSDCLALALSPFPAATVSKVKLKGAVKYNAPSAINFSAGGTFTSTDPITMDLPGGGTSTVPSGSFVGQHPALHLVYDQDTASFINSCTAKTKGVKGTGGLKKLTFATTSSFDVS
jgi:hypothetical protein